MQKLLLAFFCRIRYLSLLAEIPEARVFKKNSINIITIYMYRCMFKKNRRSLNEESSENEVANVHLNVPWAQQAEKKSLNVGYQNQTLHFKYIVILAIIIT